MNQCFGCTAPQTLVEIYNSLLCCLLTLASTSTSTCRPKKDVCSRDSSHKSSRDSSHRRRKTKLYSLFFAHNLAMLASFSVSIQLHKIRLCFSSSRLFQKHLKVGLVHSAETEALKIYFYNAAKKL